MSVTHYADDATLKRMIQLERDLAAMTRERDALQVENEMLLTSAVEEELRAENEKLRDLLRALVEAGEKMRGTIKTVCRVGVMR